MSQVERAAFNKSCYICDSVCECAWLCVCVCRNRTFVMSKNSAKRTANLRALPWSACGSLLNVHLYFLGVVARVAQMANYSFIGDWWHYI